MDKNKIAFQSKADHPRTWYTDTFLLLWPWPWADDLDIRTWPDNSEGLPAWPKWTLY